MVWFWCYKLVFTVYSIFVSDYVSQAAKVLRFKIHLSSRADLIVCYLSYPQISGDFRK